MFTLFVIGWGTVLFLINQNAERKKAINLALINSKDGYGKGIIMKKRSYKGHSITVKYKIGNDMYQYEGGWDHNPDNLQEGDSIRFRYAVDTPAIIITELEDGY
ncbi:B3 domain-containing protein [Chitinophaga nivalis]|uniref:B3 domain-containing protein n=1 Tax=Chitinophaga nivalis TaxID=2991709 RepID=A0ABT3IGB8_9BACT|nr:B3 domain-containing protein [Chitinophaga nivalis]MCW3467309.1 B3 domain-containing protein [Chitinophaga nivalis]MCW3482999.1 B3 domain-containing protein [Chitinophaga nivalis]